MLHCPVLSKLTGLAHKVGKAAAVKPLADGPRPQTTTINPLLLKGLYWS